MFYFFLSRMGHFRYAEWDVWCCPLSPRSRVDHVFLGYETILCVTSYDLRHQSRRTICLPNQRSQLDRILTWSLLYVSLRTFHRSLQIGVGGIVGELPACRSRLDSLLSALLFIVPNLPTIVTIHGPSRPCLASSSPFSRRFMECFRFLAEGLSYLRETNRIKLLCLGRIDLFCCDLVLATIKI